jgi:hypothetical protein
MPCELLQHLLTQSFLFPDTGKVDVSQAQSLYDDAFPKTYREYYSLSHLNRVPLYDYIHTVLSHHKITGFDENIFDEDCEWLFNHITDLIDDDQFGFKDEDYDNNKIVEEDENKFEPWKHEDNSYWKNRDNFVYKTSSIGGFGPWVGKYDPATNTFDTSVPEPDW